MAGIMTKCFKPLSDLTTVSAKTSRSTNHSCPFGRLSTLNYQVAKWFDALCHAVRVLWVPLSHEAKIYRVADDVAGILCQPPSCRRGSDWWPLAPAGTLLALAHSADALASVMSPRELANVMWAR
jgi:hypothetical protein